MFYCYFNLILRLLLVDFLRNAEKQAYFLIRKSVTISNSVSWVLKKGNSFSKMFQSASNEWFLNMDISEILILFALLLVLLTIFKIIGCCKKKCKCEIQNVIIFF